MSNQLKILMWKHLVHMRQNWVKLLIIYLIPMFSSGLIYWAASTTESQIVPECDYAAVPLLTLPAQFLEAKYLNTLLKTGADIFCTNLPSKAESFSLAHLDLSSYFRKKRAVSEYTSPDSSKNKSQLQDILCGERNKRIRYGDIPPMGFLLSGFIGYFPRTNQSASVMLTIAEQLRSYHLQILKFQSQSGLANETIQILQVLAQCWLDPTVRILGFNTESDAIDFAKNLDFRFNLTWGILNLQNLTNAKFDYQLISHSGSEFSISSLLLQDLLENSFIKQISSKQPVLLPQHKLKPRPCRSDERNFAQIQMIIGLVMGFSFAITSASFVGEIVYEKCAGLHEYLLVLGVSNSSLKLSWYLYGLILFGPVGLTLALIIFNLPGGILVFIDWKLIVVVFGLHTFAQLCFAYFLSTLIQTPTNSSTVAGVVYFILHLAIVFTNVSQFPKTGGSLAKARVGCIYCGTGATICLSYMIEWSKRQSSTSFSNAFTSPVDNDKFGGVGEGLLWILADIVIYLSLGWYLDKTMPKRYGLHEPFHFFLKKSYWRKAKQIGDKSATEKKQEKHNNKTLVLATDNLCKTYGQRKSLNHFRLSLYQSELVTLLGNNGAGKTTLINLLTGLMRFVNDKLIHNQLLF